MELEDYSKSGFHLRRGAQGKLPPPPPKNSPQTDPTPPPPPPKILPIIIIMKSTLPSPPPRWNPPANGAQIPVKAPFLQIDFLWSIGIFYVMQKWHSILIRHCFTIKNHFLLAAITPSYYPPPPPWTWFMAQKIALSKSFPMSYRKSLRGVHIRSLFTVADHTHVVWTGAKWLPLNSWSLIFFYYVI